LVLDKERVTHLAGPGKQVAAGKHVAALAQ
jgi:hypothetical protein